MNILTKYVLQTLAELAVLSEKDQFQADNQLILLASTLREDRGDKLKTILDEFIKEYSILLRVNYDNDKYIIELSPNFPKPEEGNYDPELIRHKIIRRTLLYKLYLTYLKEGDVYASYAL